MAAILMGSVMPRRMLEGVLGVSAARREGRHDLPLKPEHSYVTRISDVAISVDQFPHPWHDTSGNDGGPDSPAYSPTEAHERLLCAPWSLNRAVQQYRGTDGAAIAAANHSGFVLLRVPLQSGGDSLSSYEAMVELALRIMECSESPCFFNPKGEVLSGRERLAQMLSRYRAGELPPLELVMNARTFEVGAGWVLADSVGLEQVGLPDQEVVYNGQVMPMEQAIHFVRDLAMHLVQHHTAVENGDTAGGPGESVWEAMRLGQGSVSPQRPVIRWLPEDRNGMPLGMGVP